MREANGIPMSDVAFDFIFGGGEEAGTPKRESQTKREAETHGQEREDG